jgi:hypothetical protein
MASPPFFHSEKAEVNHQPPPTMASSNTTLIATANLPAEPQSEQQTEVAKSIDLEPTHKEQHSEHGDVVRDIIIGFADGLTVPFALTAGLSSYVRPFPPLLHG